MHHPLLTSQTVLDTAMKLVLYLPDIHQALYDFSIQSTETCKHLTHLLNYGRDDELGDELKKNGHLGTSDLRIEMPKPLDPVERSKALKAAKKSMSGTSSAHNKCEELYKSTAELRDRVSRETQKLMEEVEMATKLEKKRARKVKIMENDWEVRFDETENGPGPGQMIPLTAGLTPTEYTVRMERIRLTDRLRVKVRDLCFSSTFLGYVPQGIKFFDSRAAQDFYGFLISNGLTCQQYPEPLTNRILRWRIMAKIWDYLYRDFMCKPQQHRTEDDVHRLCREMQGVFHLYCPLVAGRDKLYGIFKRLIWIAGELASLLDSDTKAQYFFRVPKLKNGTNCLSTVRDSVQVLDIMGADHGDDTRDVIRLVVFGGLVRKNLPHELPHRNVVETKPCVVTYRPTIDKVLPEEQLLSGEVQRPESWACEDE